MGRCYHAVPMIASNASSRDLETQSTMSFRALKNQSSATSFMLKYVNLVKRLLVLACRSSRIRKLPKARWIGTVTCWEALIVSHPFVLKALEAILCKRMMLWSILRVMGRLQWVRWCTTSDMDPRCWTFCALGTEYMTPCSKLNMIQPWFSWVMLSNAWICHVPAHEHYWPSKRDLNNMAVSNHSCIFQHGISKLIGGNKMYTQRIFSAIRPPFV